MTDKQFRAFVPDLVRWEGALRWMYRDSLGYVTVAIGSSFTTRARRRGCRSRLTANASPDGVLAPGAGAHVTAVARIHPANVPSRTAATTLQLPQGTRHHG